MVKRCDLYRRQGSPSLGGRHGDECQVWEDTARLLRRLLVLLPAAGGGDIAMRQRIEGAAIVLDALLKPDGS